MENSTAIKSRKRLWNRNFLLLWQGQFVSAMGDVIYEIALGFWILAVTGSTGMMGALMAASTVPRVILSSFAGVLVDRSDRKWILVLTDAVRGVCVVFVGAAALLGFIEIWMVFTAGVVIGICASFFNPAVGSAMPDIVEKEQLTQANSFFAMIRTGSGILGNGLGGFLFAILQAPLMFLMNGISYLLSAISEVFIRIPKIHRQHKSRHFLADLKAGFRFTWDIRGLRYLFILAAVINFCASIAFILILPLFQRTAHLGPGNFGILMAVMTGGMFLGYIVTASIKITPAKRLAVFIAGGLVMGFSWALFPLFLNMPWMLVTMFIGGFFNAIVNVLIETVTQLTVPQDMRGKVFGLLGTLSQGLTPIAMAVGGLLGEIFPLRTIISFSLIAVILVMLPLPFSGAFRRFISFDPKRDTVETIK
jgi:MFS family permease